ncbi:putative phage-encoded protein-like protein [Thalassospira xiamenensis M-5 = DSM 17429]|uniref:Phage-encoded protein-like protein n=1 Tax=Thalassospira xiamenensis M-5 = DSM 17429 TaxID=1123366 RepID=A0AB72UH05_9PROT|nr:putative phage-encoded protein-like protein [Thalassospira xiamenensis M-5 = DSM 17429]
MLLPGHHQKHSTTNTAPIVTLKDNQAFANSRDVAEFFGKRHDNVLYDVEKLVMQVRRPEISGDLRMFFPKPYVNPQNKQTYRSWDMTKDGFTLLVMGYTGKKTMQFKLRYIEEFNRMEAKLKEQANAWLV